MRPFDEIPLEESDYSDVALLLAGAREWPSDDFIRDLDARVGQRFAAQAVPRGAGRLGPGRLPRWVAGPAVALVAGVVAAVVVLSGGGSGGLVNGSGAGQTVALGTPRHGSSNRLPATDYGNAVNTTATLGAPTNAQAGTSAGTRQLAVPSVQHSGSSTASAPVAPGRKQIQSAQLSLTTPTSTSTRWPRRSSPWWAPSTAAC